MSFFLEEEYNWFNSIGWLYSADAINMTIMIFPQYAPLVNHRGLRLLLTLCINLQPHNSQPKESKRKIRP